MEHLDELVTHASRHRSRLDEGISITRPMPGLELLWHETPTAIEASIYDPVVCLILQGRKQVTLGPESWSFGPGECLLVSHDLAVRSRITRAPYLALVFSVELTALRKLYDEVAGSALDTERARAVETHRAAPELLDALLRYLRLADTPADAAVLGPLVARELHYRLLTAPFGGMLRNLIRHDSHASAIARAIGHIRSDIRARVEIPELARRVGMSVSAFHQHFRAVTSTTPLQYQKELRLLEARRLLRAGGASVTAAALDVGYESASQFSREYTRKFGAPPSRSKPETGPRALVDAKPHSSSWRSSSSSRASSSGRASPTGPSGAGPRAGLALPKRRTAKNSAGSAMEINATGTAQSARSRPLSEGTEMAAGPKRSR
jgi:AraC-like DNA-binding protein